MAVSTLEVDRNIATLRLNSQAFSELSNKELATWIYKNCDFDQIILEFHDPEGDPNSGWVHVSYVNDSDNRKQTLTINKNGTFPGFI